MVSQLYTPVCGWIIQWALPNQQLYKGTAFPSPLLNTLTFHLSRDDLNSVLRDVEGVVERDGLCQVAQDERLVSLLEEPHTSCAQDVERGLRPLLLRDVAPGKVQERYQALVGLLWVLPVRSYT